MSIVATAESKHAIVEVKQQYLNIGNNTIIITVTPEYGSVKNYSLHIYRQNGDARLKSIQVNQGVLKPAFRPGVKEYTWRVKSGDQNLAITTEPMDSMATVKEIHKSQEMYTYEVISEDGKYIEY